jgi:hypothetical protein
MKRTSLQSQAVFVTALLAALILTGGLVCSVPAQNKAVKFKVGDRVESNITGTWRKCTVTKVKPWFVDPNEASGYLIKCDVPDGMENRDYSAGVLDVRAISPTVAAEDTGALDVGIGTNAKQTAAPNKAMGNGPGAPFNARDPRICSDTKNPLSGGPSSDQAKQYVICGLEGVKVDALYLVEDVKVDIGAARAYSVRSEANAGDIDPKFPVYPLRASFNQYQCDREYADSNPQYNNVGRNCSVYVEPKAEGKCVKTTFGDWRCAITSRTSNSTTKKLNMPPPK